jgi:hypothetical protein
MPVERGPYRPATPQLLKARAAQLRAIPQKPKPGVPARPVSQPVAASTTPVPSPVSLSLAQAANQQVNAQLNPQLAAQDTFNARQNQAVQSFANALLGKLQPIAGQVGQDYNQAIQQTGALSNQAAQYLQNANPTPQVQALLQSAGAPAEQQAQIGNQLGQTFGGGAGVLSFLAGAVPGGRLAADKAAMQGQAAQLPGFAALKGQQDLASALGSQSEARAKLEATRPGLFQQAEHDIQANNLARQRNTLTAQGQAERVREFGVTRADKQHQFDVTEQDKKDAAAAKAHAADVVEWWKEEGAKAKGAPKFSPSATRVLGYQSDQYGNPLGGTYKAVPGYKVDPATGLATKIVTPKKTAAPKVNTTLSAANHYLTDTAGNPILRGGQRVPYKAAGTKGTTFTASQIQTYRGLALTGADLAFNGRPATPGKNDGLAKLSYQDAIRHGRESGIPDSILMPALNSVYPPGVQGRPQTKTTKATQDFFASTGRGLGG